MITEKIVPIHRSRYVGLGGEGVGGGIHDVIFFLFLHENMCHEYALEAPQFPCSPVLLVVLELKCLVNTVKVMLSWSVYLTTFFLGRLIVL